MYPRFPGEQNWRVTLTTGVRLLTLPATHGGPRRRKVRSVSFPPKGGENSTRSLAPPFPTEPASLGFGGGPKGPPVREPAKTKGPAGTLRQKEKTRIDLAVYPGLVRPKPEAGKGACGTFSPYGSLPKRASAWRDA